MKLKKDIQNKIDSLWDEYNSSVEKVADLYLHQPDSRDEINDLLLQGVFAYKQLSMLEWVLSKD